MPNINTPNAAEALRQLLHALDVLDDVHDGIERVVDAHTAHVAIGVARKQGRDALALHYAADTPEQPHQGGIEVTEITADELADVMRTLTVPAAGVAVLA